MPRDPKKIPAIFIFDFETGGLDKKNNLHSQVVPVTEFACVGINGVTLEEVIKYDNLVKPYSDTLQYQAQAAQITGITKEKCQREGIPLKQLVEDICTVFTELQELSSKTFKPIICAHNSGYDVPFLQDIFARCKVDLSKYIQGYNDNLGNFTPYHIDTIAMAKLLWGDVTDTDTKFGLEPCLMKAGLEISDSHRALNDTLALTDLLRYMIVRMRSGTSEVTVVDGKATSIRSKFEW